MEQLYGSLLQKGNRKMEEYRDKGFSQLWRVARVYCPIHGHSEVSMLSPISCPGCEVERGHGDMLRRSNRKERRRELAEHEYQRRLEKDAKNEG